MAVTGPDPNAWRASEPRPERERLRDEAPLRTGLLLADDAARPEVLERFRRARYVVAAVEPVAPEGLRRALEDAVELALAERGALPPEVPEGCDPRRVVRDQLQRTRALGAPGLAIGLPALRGLDAPDAPLDAVVLVSAWLHEARRPDVAVVAHPESAGARLLVPTTLGEVIAQAALADARARSSAANPRLEAGPTRARFEPVAREAWQALRVLEELEARGRVSPEALAHDEIAAVAAIASAVHADADAETDADAPPAAEPKRPRARALSAPQNRRTRPVEAAPHDERDHDHEHEQHDAREPDDAAESALEVTPRELPPRFRAPRALEVATLETRPLKASGRSTTAAEWRTFASELDAARGPRPVGLLERLYVTRYVPLLGAIARGETDAGARQMVDAFRASFEHSYVDASAAMRVTGKRPLMVFDVPESAARIARQTGARQVKLLLVDSMRFDVGERVAAKLKELVGSRAACVERQLLWSALPTKTPTQLALLARGEAGLREAMPLSEDGPGVTRGRAVSTLRRERVGSREMLKLDLLEARLVPDGAPYEERLDALAAEIAPILARHLDGLPPRTLLYVFGDHGFRLAAAPDGSSTGPASQGGASPEEVLVPGYAWLASGVH